MSIEKYSEGFVCPEKAPYTTMANIVLQNLKNPDSLAIWVYLQSLPPDWTINKSQLRSHFGLSEKKIDKTLSHLKKCNLLEFIRPREELGQFEKGYYRALCGSKYKQESINNICPSTTPQIHPSGNPPEWERGYLQKK